MKLWVDDERRVPDYSWDRAKTYDEAITALTLFEYEELSLDHDLGCWRVDREMTGYDIALFLAERKQQGLYVPHFINCHSANPAGKRNIESVVVRYLLPE